MGVARHPEGGAYLFKARELLVFIDDMPAVQALLRHWDEPSAPGGNYAPKYLPGSHWIRLTLGPDSTQVPRLVADIRAQERPGTDLPPFRVSPNHVLRGNSHGTVGGPAGPPEPAMEHLAPPPPDVETVDPIRVALYDTGELVKNLWFADRVQRMAPGPAASIPDHELDLPDPLPRYAGHCTFVAGLVLQHAPRARVFVERTLDSYGETTDTNLAAAIRRLPADMHVLHLSCAGPTAFNMGLPATEEALTEVWERNPKLVVVAPAGNGSTDRPWFPGAMKGVVCVGALGSQPTKAGFSNWGSWVDVSAPGVRAKSTFLTGTTTPEQMEVLPGVPVPDHLGEEQTFDGWAYWSGTSFAAARVTGAIALNASVNGMDAPRAAFDLFGGGRTRRIDSGFDMGVPVFPPSWT